MMHALVQLRASRRAVAALEFALTAPFLLILLGGVTDFGFALWDKAKLADAVAIGAQYAYLNAGTGSASSVQTLVGTTSGLSGSSVSVTGPTSYCLAGTPPALVSPTTPCADGTAPGKYMTITASYAYPAILPAYSMLSGKTLTESATVRIQ
jgi:Flp pilus assembly protein TadG